MDIRFPCCQTTVDVPYDRNERIWIRCDSQPEQLQGKRIWAELRLGSRYHQVAVGHLRVSGPDADGRIAIDAVFPYRCVDPAQNDWVFHIAQQQIEQLVATIHRDYDFKFLGTLGWGEK